MKKAITSIITVILVLTFSFSLFSCKNNADENKNITYTETTLNSIYQVWSANRARAENEYVGQYVSIKAEVGSVFSDDYFSLYEYQYNYAGQKVGFDSAGCRAKNLKEIVLSLNEGDVITIKGKITSLTRIGDFSPSIDVLEILPDIN